MTDVIACVTPFCLRCRAYAAPGGSTVVVAKVRVDRHRNVRLVGYEALAVGSDALHAVLSRDHLGLWVSA